MRGRPLRSRHARRVRRRRGFYGGWRWLPPWGFGGGIEIERFGEKNFDIFLAAEDGAERRSDFAGRERTGSHLIEERLEEVKIAAIKESDPRVGAFQALRGDQAAKATTNDEDAMRTWHEKLLRKRTLNLGYPSVSVR